MARMASWTSRRMASQLYASTVAACSLCWGCGGRSSIEDYLSLRDTESTGSTTNGSTVTTTATTTTETSATTTSGTTTTEGYVATTGETSGTTGDAEGGVYPELAITLITSKGVSWQYVRAGDSPDDFDCKRIEREGFVIIDLEAFAETGSTAIDLSISLSDTNSSLSYDEEPVYADRSGGPLLLALNMGIDSSRITAKAFQFGSLDHSSECLVTLSTTEGGGVRGLLNCSDLSEPSYNPTLDQQYASVSIDFYCPPE